MDDPEREGASTETDRLAVFEAFFAASPDATLLVDDAGRILLANAAVERLLGYPPDALRGRNVGVLVPKRFNRHERHVRSFLAAPRARPMGTGLELVARTADDSETPVDVNLTPLAVDGRTVVVCSIHDLRSRAAGGETLRVLATALSSAANGIVITGVDGIITWVNPAACAITGYDADELIGQHTRLLKSGRHESGFYQELWKTVMEGSVWTGTIVNRRKDGSLYDEQQTIAPVLDGSGQVSRFIAVKQDVTEQRRLEQALHRANDELAGRMAEIEALNGLLRDQAIRDPLTQLYNRRYLDEALTRELARTTTSHRPLAVAAIDIDNFKRVNDALGHPVGDRVLRQLADVLRANVRKSDVICRVGGDEFLVLMPGAEPEVAAERTELWRKAFAAASSATLGSMLRCTISIGVATARGTAQQTLQHADAALYAAKRAGRNRVVSAGDPPA